MPFKLFNHLRKGTTLVETLIFTAVGSILLLSISSVFISGLYARGLVDAQQRLVYVDEFIFSRLQSWLNSSPSIQTPVSGTTQQLVFSLLDGGTMTVELSGADLLFSNSIPESGTLNSLDVRVTRFDVTRLNEDSDTVRIEVTYEVSTSAQHTIEHSTIYTFSSFYD